MKWAIIVVSWCVCVCVEERGGKKRKREEKRERAREDHLTYMPRASSVSFQLSPTTLHSEGVLIHEWKIMETKPKAQTGGQGFCPGSNLGSMRARQYTYRHKYRDYVLILWSMMQNPGCSRHFFKSLSLQSLHPSSLGHFLPMMTVANWTVLLYKPLYPVQGNLAAFKHSILPVPSTRQILGIPKPSCSVNTHWYVNSVQTACPLAMV